MIIYKITNQTTDPAAYTLNETLTFIGTSYPLQRGDIVVMLANREGEHTNL